MPKAWSSPQNRYLNEDKSWFTEHIISRLAWLAVAVSAVAMIPVGICKVLYLLVKLHPLEALKSAILIPLMTIAVSLFAVINLFRPSIGRRITASLIVPAKLKSSDTAQMETIYDTPTGDTQIDMAIVDPDQSKSGCQPYVIKFCGNAYTYQDCKAVTQFESNLFQQKIGVFNYPAINGKPSTSSKSLINAGIAQVYSLLDTFKDEPIENQLQLYGHSLGGGVALQVAKYFKQKYNLDIPVLVDRSFSSLSAVVAGIINNINSIPMWYGKIVAKLLLYAAGDFELDSIEAFKTLKPEMVSYFNLGRPEESPDYQTGYQKRPWWRKLLGYWITDPVIPNNISQSDERPWQQRLLGYLTYQHADPVIPDGSTFAEGVEEEMTPFTLVRSSDLSIYSGLHTNRRTHLVFGKIDNGDAHETNYHGHSIDWLFSRTKTSRIETGVIKDTHTDIHNIYRDIFNNPRPRAS